MERDNVTKENVSLGMNSTRIKYKNGFEFFLCFFGRNGRILRMESYDFLGGPTLYKSMQNIAKVKCCHVLHASAPCVFSRQVDRACKNEKLSQCV